MERTVKKKKATDLCTLYFISIYLRETHYNSSHDYETCSMLSRFSHVGVFAIPWTVARQAPLSMGLSRQEYWNGLLHPPPEDLCNPGTDPSSLTSPELAGGFFTTSTIWEKSAGLRGWRPRTARGAVIIHQQFAGEFPLAGEAILFVLFRPSTDWMRPTHIMENSLELPKFTDLNVNLIPNHPPING